VKGPYIGPKGGKYRDPEHKHAWTAEDEKRKQAEDRKARFSRELKAARTEKDRKRVMERYQVGIDGKVATEAELKAKWAKEDAEEAKDKAAKEQERRDAKREADRKRRKAKREGKKQVSIFDKIDEARREKRRKDLGPISDKPTTGPQLGLFAKAVTHKYKSRKKGPDGKWVYDYDEAKNPKGKKAEEPKKARTKAAEEQPKARSKAAEPPSGGRRASEVEAAAEKLSDAIDEMKSGKRPMPEGSEDTTVLEARLQEMKTHAAKLRGDHQAEEPKAEEPKAEEPKAEEKAEEPKQDDRGPGTHANEDGTWTFNPVTPDDEFDADGFPREKGPLDSWEEKDNEYAKARVERRNKVANAVKQGTIEFGGKYGNAVLLPDASEPGRWRFSVFDEDGFRSHRTFDTRNEAMAEMADDGFHEPDRGALGKMSTTDRWAIGERKTKLVQTINSLADRDAQKAITDAMVQAGEDREALDRILESRAINALREGDLEAFGALVSGETLKKAIDDEEPDEDEAEAAKEERYAEEGIMDDDDAEERKKQKKEDAEDDE
jgi:hypothetical protein